MVCVQCQTDPCKGCPKLSFGGFYGWSGVCVRCHSKKKCASHSPTEVCQACKWNCCKACGKERPLEERVGGSDWYCSCSGGLVVIEILDDDEAGAPPPSTALSLRRRLKKEFPHFPDDWPLPAAGEEASDGYSVLLDRASEAFKRVEQQVQEATQKGSEAEIAALLKGYPSSTVEPKAFKVIDVKRIMDPLKYECYYACKRKMEKLNSKRAPRDRFETSEQIMFHGTTRRNELSIIENGFMVGRCKNGVYGDGVYFSRYPLIPNKHADREGLRVMFMCRVLEGKPDITNILSKMPRPGFDSGGDSTDGRGHKTVIFDNNHIYVEYAIYYVEEECALPAQKRQRT
jgi:hypothetical protein